MTIRRRTPPPRPEWDASTSVKKLFELLSGPGIPIDGLWDLHLPRGAENTNAGYFGGDGSDSIHPRCDFLFRPETIRVSDADIEAVLHRNNVDGHETTRLENVLAFYDDVPFESGEIRATKVALAMFGKASRSGFFEPYPGVFFSVEKESKKRKGNAKGYAVSLEADTYGLEPFSEEWSAGETLYAVLHAIAPSIAEGRVSEGAVALCLDAAEGAAKNGEMLRPVVDRLSGKETGHPLLASVLFELAANGHVEMEFMGHTVNARDARMNDAFGNAAMEKRFGPRWKWTPDIVSGASFSVSPGRERIERFVEKLVTRIEPFVGLSEPFDSSFRVGDAAHYENLFGLVHRFFPRAAERCAYALDSFVPSAKGNFAHLRRTTCTWSTFFGSGELPAYCGRAAREREFFDAAVFSLDAAKKKELPPPSLKSFFGFEGALEISRGILFEEHICVWKTEELAFMEVPIGFPTEVPAKFRSLAGEVFQLFMESDETCAENSGWLAGLEDVFSECVKDFREYFGSPGCGGGFPCGLDGMSLSRAEERMREAVLRAAMARTEREDGCGGEEVVL